MHRASHARSALRKVFWLVVATASYPTLRSRIQERGDMSAHEKPLRWRKSSFSQNGDCVEWALGKECVYVRDSKNAANTTLKFTYSEWLAFMAAVKTGRVGLGHHR